MRHYATYADGAYLGRLKALHASMVRHCGEFKLHVLAWDDTVWRWCEQNRIDSWSVQAFTLGMNDLQAALGNRSRVEQMWTVGPAWVAWIMGVTRMPVTYVDADVMFHSSPEPVFAEIGDAPAAVIPHGFCESAPPPIPTRRTHEVFGKYNVGLVHFRDPVVAQDWAAKCRHWCYEQIDMLPIKQAMADMPEHILVKNLEKLSGFCKYADQKYLDAWPGQFGAHVVKHPGACAGPWGVHAQPLDVRDGVIHFGGRPLVAWHYSSYRELPDGHTVMSRPEYMLTDEQIQILYVPYMKALEAAR